jgi:hypothetical protein
MAEVSLIEQQIIRTKNIEIKTWQREVLKLTKKQNLNFSKIKVAHKEGTLSAVAKTEAKER